MAVLLVGLTSTVAAPSSSAQDAPPTEAAPPPVVEAAPPPPPPVAPPAETAPPVAEAPAPPVTEAAPPASVAPKKATTKRVATKKATTKRATTTKKATTKRAATVAPTRAVRGTSVEIDISRQVMTLRRGSKLTTIPVSTGSGRRYCSGGRCATARTPRGRFVVQRRINGWRTSHLGRLYNPLYFSGGYAIHGGKIPGYPASHGCVRIPMGVASWFPGAVPNGTPVWIHD